MTDGVVGKARLQLLHGVVGVAKLLYMAFDTCQQKRLLYTIAYLASHLIQSSACFHGAPARGLHLSRELAV